jgi:isopenicillin N synthase-like dioxygenase
MASRAASRLAALPVVDLAPLLSSNWKSEAALHTARELARSASGLGFLLVENAPLQPPLVRRALEGARKFFLEASPAAKRAAQAQRGLRGYSRFESAGGPEDGIEALSVGNPAAAAGALRREYYARRGVPAELQSSTNEENRWPPDASELRRDMEAAWEAAAATSLLLLRALEAGLGLPEAALQRLHQRRDFLFQFKYYPQPTAPAVAAGRVRFPEHADLSSVTLLAQDAEAGLEVWSEQHREWLRIAHDASLRRLLVNTGDFVERWSGGRLPSTRHRVVAAAGAGAGDRVSAVFFAQPDWDAPLTQLAGERQAQEGEEELAGDRMPLEF